MKKQIMKIYVIQSEPEHTKDTKFVIFIIVVISFLNIIAITILLILNLRYSFIEENKYKSVIDQQLIFVGFFILVF